MLERKHFNDTRRAKPLMRFHISQSGTEETSHCRIDLVCATFPLCFPALSSATPMDYCTFEKILFSKENRDCYDFSLLHVLNGPELHAIPLVGWGI